MTKQEHHNKEAYSVNAFCNSYSISRSYLYKLWDAGNGPRKFKVGNKTLISRAAATDWLNQFDADSDPNVI